MIVHQWEQPPGHLAIQAGEIQVWVARLDEQTPSVYWEWLADEERGRAERIRHPVWSRYFAVGRGILRCLLGAYLGRSPGELVFQYAQWGKPALAGNLSADLSFNVAHSADLAVYVFAAGVEVGVDIEQIRPLTDLDGMAAMALSPAERADLHTRPADEKLVRFFELWACKEAVLKMTGSGLTQPMTAVQIGRGPCGVEPIDTLGPDGRRCALWRLLPAGGYVGAVAASLQR